MIRTQAECNALGTGYTAMKIRRVFGGYTRGIRNILRYTRLIQNAAPVLAIALVAQSVAEGAVLTYAFAAGTFTDDETLTYSATLADNSALPAWLTFTPATRTFSGTAPAVDVDTDINVLVSATDTLGRTTQAPLTITVTAV